MYSVMWSEHCSYKSSKVHLRQFGEKAPQTDALLVGIGENAGVVDIGQGWAVTFKVESHNHPTYVEPYQGAATGVGGIVRDILAMGARPVAVMDPLRFGPADDPDTRRVLPGVVAGIGGYGNCLGLPNIGGEVVFDPSYHGNPLVNALCVGVLRHEDIKLANASGPGNQVVLFGARTGGDGIGGVSRAGERDLRRRRPGQAPERAGRRPVHGEGAHRGAASRSSPPTSSSASRTSAAPGISCATTELASAGTGGMRVDLDRVPLRDATLAPEEILMSESQERMCAVVEPDKLDAFLAVCAKWDVDATVHRRGHRRRPPRDLLARRARRRRAAAHRRARGPGLRAPVRPPGGPGRAAGRRPDALAAADDRRRAAGHVAAPGRLAQPRRQVVGHRPVRPLRAGQHRAGPARGRRHDPRSTRRPASASRSRPTATAATPSSTRTPAPSSRWPRRTATSPRPAPSRSPSPTA